MFIKSDLEEGVKSLKSTLSKCEKVVIKLKEGSSAHTLTVRRIKALKIAITLMGDKLEEFESKIDK